MKKILSGFVALFVFVAFATPSHALTKAEAQAHAEKAAAHYAAVGKDKAIADFGSKTGGFVDGDLYVFATDFDGVMTAHPIKPALIGKNVLKIKDSNGVALFAEFIKTAKGAGKGWVNYVWPRPGTGKMANKTSYIIKVDDNMLVGVGAYLD